MIFAISLPSFGGWLYQIFMAKNILVRRSDKVLIIPSNTTWDQLVPVLEKGNYVSDIVSFAAVAKLLKYQQNIKAGRYILKSNMSNLQAVRLLRSGEQSPVRVTFNNVRIKSQLAGRLTRNLEVDSTTFLQTLNDPQKVAEYGFDTTTIVTMFLPDTYQMYWNSSPNSILKRMKAEYDKFWTKDRIRKAKQLQLTPLQVTILASIVAEETLKMDEAPRVAGVYLNRLNRNMLLQADPTVKFAIGDFAKKRILDVDTEYDSPYNTYKYAGLPPGPIRLPSKRTINAVLNYEKHEYIYFCAKEDFSGYHNFAKSYTEHSQNARRYHNALNALKIYK